LVGSDTTVGLTSPRTLFGSLLCRVQLEDSKCMSDEDLLQITNNLSNPEAVGELSKCFLDELKRRCAKLAKRNAKALYILTIDALTQLRQRVYTDADGCDVNSHDLAWFPPSEELPDNLRIVVSSLQSTADPAVGLGKTPMQVRTRNVRCMHCSVCG
jgi:hypothetical protein